MLAAAGLAALAPALVGCGDEDVVPDRPAGLPETVPAPTAPTTTTDGAATTTGTAAGGGGRQPAGAAKLSFIAEGDDICRGLRRSRSALGREPQERSARARYYGRLSDLLTRTAGAFRSRSIPEDGRDEVDDFVASLDQQADLLRRLSTTPENAETSERALTTEIQSVAARGVAAARMYGFTACG